jgi:outer membrane protein
MSRAVRGPVYWRAPGFVPYAITFNRRTPQPSDVMHIKRLAECRCPRFLRMRKYGLYGGNQSKEANQNRRRGVRRNRFVLPIAIALALVEIDALAQASQASFTLDQCYQLALDRSKTVAGQVQLIEQAEARINQARAGFYPSIIFGATALRQETPGVALAQSIFPSNQDTVRASATQNLFKGVRDLATVQQRRLTRRAAEFARDQAETQLFVDVAQAYYDVLGREADLRNYTNEVTADNERRRELLELKRLVRARDADIATVEAALATLEGAMANTRGLLNVARETLSFLTGLPPRTGLVDDQALPGSVPVLDFWLARLDDRPDVRQARSNMEAAEEGIDVAKAGARPSLDLSANYYFRRSGISDDVNWDVQLSFTQPLFTGGLVQAQVREAVSQKQGNEITLAQTRETAVRDIRSVHSSLQANLDQAARLERAVALNERSYELLRKDNRVGLATNVDVLQALSSLYQTRRAWEDVRYAAKNNYARLRAISARRDGDAPDTVDLAPAAPQRQ